MTEQETTDLAKVFAAVTRVELDLRDIKQRLEVGDDRFTSIEQKQGLIVDAAQRAFNKAEELNETVRGLYCLKPKPSSPCPPGEVHEEIQAPND